MATLKTTALGIAVQGRALLRGLAFTIGPGERVAIVGRSGAGKSTLLRTLAGLIDPLEGTIRLNHQTPSDVGWPTWRRRVLYVNQRAVMFAGSIRDNLNRPFAYQVAKGKPMPTDADLVEALAQVGLSDVPLGQEARTLSEGQRQRVGLIRALLTEPDVLLLDEPTSALDEESVAIVEAYVSASSCAVAMVTHDSRQAKRFCHRVEDLDGYRETPS